MGSGFSVLLPVYDGDSPEFLERSFDSVTVDQTRPPSEVVIVQDGPVRPELTRMLARLVDRSDVPVVLVEIPVNGGLARALDLGLERCSHEIVARQDADDISVPERFAVQVPIVEGGADVVGSAIEEFVVEGDGGLVRVPPVGHEEIERYARFRSPFNHPSVVYRRSAVRAVGGYEELPLMEDYWLFARMIHAGAWAENVVEPLVLYRVGAGAYARRGGTRLLQSEVELQRRMWRAGMTSFWSFSRNVAVRGVYRVTPEPVRRRAYRAAVRRDAEREAHTDQHTDQPGTTDAGQD
ncbi:glycosyl transferase family 2 [Sediminihabitans luteus]|uniref:Glycosyl transferase family 2 n=1 Tax=Sediminihabitans luteus TaxID=1138585 RepID=A0A2M9CDF9_9CELL|nr:glycosyltransferase [Sediminihabitans luteus]PJJ69976.1 glycosyl transferase family 2 [Sediminihabitans luteus]GII99297.1 glycosyl hydrolase [Sediminihabitans luteus]